jgi:hypothetical protein
MATVVVQARPVVMRESIASLPAQNAKEAACFVLLLIAAALCVALARRGPECALLGSKVDDWVQPTVVFLLGGQLAVFHNLGLSAIL